MFSQQNTINWQPYRKFNQVSNKPPLLNIVKSKIVSLLDILLCYIIHSHASGCTLFYLLKFFVQLLSFLVQGQVPKTLANVCQWGLNGKLTSSFVIVNLMFCFMFCNHLRCLITSALQLSHKTSPTSRQPITTVLIIAVSTKSMSLHVTAISELTELRTLLCVKLPDISRQTIWHVHCNISLAITENRFGIFWLMPFLLLYVWLLPRIDLVFLVDALVYGKTQCWQHHIEP